MNVKTDPLLDFENQLFTSLQRVNPEPRFVSHLRDRLVTPDVTIYSPDPDPEVILKTIGLARVIILTGLVTGLGLLSLKRALVD